MSSPNLHKGNLEDATFMKILENQEWVTECAGMLGDFKLVKQVSGKMNNQVCYNSSHLVEADGNIYDRDPPGQRSIYIPPGDTFKESYRLSTFIKFPQEVPVNPRHLASAGFYYTGYKDRVKCFGCGLCVENWVVGDDVRGAQWHRSDCVLVQAEDSGNVPIGGGGFSRFLMSNRSQDGNNSIGTRSPSTGGGKHTTFTGKVLQSDTAGSAGPVPMQSARPVVRNRQTDQIVEFATITSLSHENFLRNLDLRKESERNRTFAHWPSETRTVYSTDLARSGFFYLGNFDRVQCFSCAGVLRNWNYGDNVEAEHHRHFPHCKMTQGSETRNVPLSQSERTAVNQQIVFHEPPDPSENETRDLRNMFPCLDPHNPHMRNLENRIESFQSWPSSRINATPFEIARAGFYYLGEGDRVKCWYCSGGLQNWDPQDERWTEHAKWFPT
uniref:ZF(RING)-14 zinc finger protein n=1 Tax=Phallusia mammillata TaxID=59560 RepID=A0A6F9D7S0_9ASCI|nr:ZF(RING)-14 zinc finger protein [Phallusia mammillata]